VRSKCKFAAARCTALEVANSRAHDGKVSKARWELSRAFNGSFGLHSDRSGSSNGSSSDGGGGPLNDVLFEWVGHMGECPGIVDDSDRYVAPSLNAKRQEARATETLLHTRAAAAKAHAAETSAETAAAAASGEGGDSGGGSIGVLVTGGRGVNVVMDEVSGNCVANS
jgi:hypothetical protein